MVMARVIAACEAVGGTLEQALPGDTGADDQRPVGGPHLHAGGVAAVLDGVLAGGRDGAAGPPELDFHRFSDISMIG